MLGSEIASSDPVRMMGCEEYRRGNDDDDDDDNDEEEEEEEEVE